MLRKLVVTLAKACDSHWQVKEHIFIDSNKLTKSKQIMLNTLNELRMCYVLERSIFSGQTKREKVRVLISRTDLFAVILFKFLRKIVMLHKK